MTTIIVLLVLGAAGWVLYLVYKNKHKDELKPLDMIFGDARIATHDEIEEAGLFKNQGIRLGIYAPFDILGGDPAARDVMSEVIRYQGDAHLITVARTRSGKGRDVLIPALLEYQGSVIAIDPKGQLAAVTAAAREKMGQKVVVLNPFNILPDILGPFASRYNPMAALDPEAESFGADADNLAEGIVYATGGDTHWHESARQLVAGVMMHLAKSGPANTRNLATVRTLISGPYSVLSSLVAEAMKTGDTLICDKLARFTPDQEDNKEVRGIISSAITQTGFIGNKAIANCLSGSDFKFAELKDRPMTVYLVLPTRYLKACGKWFRLVLAGALDELLREEKGKVPVLAMMDEFAQLGRLSAMENAMGLAAGYGLQLWPVIQDLTRLQELYGKSWETFLANSGVRQFFAPHDVTTSNYLSDLCGDTTVFPESKSFREITQKEAQGGFTGQTSSLAPTARKLFLPLEIRRMGKDRQLLFVEGVDHVIAGSRKPYFQTDEFMGKFALDPYHVFRPVNDNVPEEVPQAGVA